MTANPAQTHQAKLLRHERQLLGVKISPCGNFAVAGDFDGHVQRWNLTTDARTQLEHHQSWVQALAYHADGRLFSADFWGRIAAWSAADESPRLLWAVEGHEGWIRTSLVTRNGRYLATAGNDLAVRLWDVATGRLVRELTGHTSHVYTLAQHPDGHLLSGDQEGNLKEWDVDTGRLVRSLSASELWHSPQATMSLTGVGGVRSMGFSANGQKVYCGGITDTQSAGFAAGKPHIVVLDWATGQPQRPLRFREEFEGFVTHLSWHPEGFLLGAGGGKGGAIWFWRPDEEEPFHTVKQVPHVRELAVHSDGVRLLTALFVPRGQGGNGRRNRNMAEYVENVGAIGVYSMSTRTAPMRPMRAGAR
jgi:WD40 repeat protein